MKKMLKLNYKKRYFKLVRKNKLRKKFIFNESERKRNMKRRKYKGINISGEKMVKGSFELVFFNI